MKIQVQSVRQQFGATIALDDLSLEISGDKIVGLLGRNGSGKSTLLNIMAGFRKPTAGQVLIDGQPVFENADAMARIALIREKGDTVEDSEKVDEALRYAAWLRPNWDDDRARDLLEKFEVSPKQKLGQLSRGRRSALGIALGLAARADLTMLDETYLGLDAPSRYTFYDELLQEYMEHPRTFIVSSHLIEEVGRILEDIVIIDRGRVLVHSPGDQFAAQGTAVTGPVEIVDEIVAGRKVIGNRTLGRTRSAMVYGGVDDRFVAQVNAAGLDLEPMSIQDVFVYLTTGTGDNA